MMEENANTPVSLPVRAALAPAAAPAATLFLACLLALLVAILLSPAPASALSGGAAIGNGGANGKNGNAGNAKDGCMGLNLGRRDLRFGDCGADVRTLHWLLATRGLTGWGGKVFVGSTRTGVKRFQKQQGINRSGVVNKATVVKLKKRMKRHQVSWYNAWGNRTACGQKLKKKTIGVAVPAKKAKRFPCGTKVVLNYGGRWVRARVIDTGGFGGKTKWDLTERTAARLNPNYKSDGLFKLKAGFAKKKKPKKGKKKK